MQGQRVLVSGGAGAIGSELCRQLAKDNTVYLIDINETGYFDLVSELGIDGRLCDIRDKALVHEIVDFFRPDVIFHAAALKHVTPSMQTPREYVQTNLIGTLNMLESAHKFGAKFINISSDKAVQTENVMGWTKRGTELFTQIYAGVSVRFGNVLGSRGSVIPIWQKQLEQGKPLTVTDSRMERYFMSVEEAVTLVIEAGERGKPGDIYILDMVDRKRNVLELAKRLIDEAEHNAGIKIIGKRPGEALSESLFSEEERSRIQKDGRFFILPAARSGVLEEAGNK